MPKGTVTYKQNNLERQEALKKKKLAAGLVAECYPDVSNIVLRMTYYQRGSTAALMVRTLNFLPNDYAYFHLDCMREGCTNGGYDLTPVVAGMVKGRKRTSKGKISCCGKNTELHPGHASIAYEVSIQNGRHAK